jgi:tripeptide aminopeptidase
VSSYYNDPCELFVELARIDSPPGHERHMADRLLELARASGIDAVERDTPGAPRATAGSVVLSLPATAPGGVPICFCAHTDTIPTGPIEPVVADGLVRSAGDTILGADNKASVAAMLVAAQTLAAQRPPQAGVEFVFTPLEEAGCVGAKALDFGALRARCAFVYDHAGPIGTYVRSAPAGYVVGVVIRGRAAHAGIAPEEGRSAIQAASRLVDGLALGRLADGATVNAGVIRGGTAHNVVPERCVVWIDVRARSRSRVIGLCEEVRAAAHAAATSCGCEAELTVEEKYRDYRIDADEPVMRLALSGLAEVGGEPVAVDAGGGSDANIFNEHGIRCINLGSGMRAIHTPDESIAVADVRRLCDLTLAIVAAASSS